MSENREKKINLNFQKLTPSKNINLGIYKEALDFVFSDSDIKNIAISGSYGAGKSSLIETYRSVSEEKFINISLAHFENEKNGRENVSPNNLEGKIINQLIHQIKATEIPLTRFKTKENPSKRKSFTHTMLLISTISFLVINIKYQSWLDIVSTLYRETQWGWLPFLNTAIFQSLTVLFILLSSIYIVYYFITVLKNKLTIKKAVAKDFEIEVFEEADSYFDKHLNEVLYLFDNSGANVIVFEDMDRFDDNHIFEKLREINTLINNRMKKRKSLEIFLLTKLGNRIRNKLISMDIYDSDGMIISESIDNTPKKGNKYLIINNYIDNRLNKKIKPIRFMYLLRDDVFISKERTKFFDFIIPVIPVVDSTNSYDKFIDKFKDAGILEDFDQTFLHDISLYVDDYRILKNIHNEFLSYYEKLGINEYKLKCNELLAMIIYKNIFPKDFADLQLNKGYIRNIFNNKQIIIDEEVEAKRTEILNINNRIQELSSQILGDIDELDAVFLKVPSLIKINEKVIDNSYTPLQIIKEIKENDYMVEIGKQHDSYFGDINIKYTQSDLRDDFNNLMNISEYKKRYSLINANKDNEIKILEEQNREIEKHIDNIKNKSLNMIITRKNKKNVFDIRPLKQTQNGNIDQYKYIKENDYYDLLVYLITNGYIDENRYNDYMSFFYPHSISRNDKLFLRSITD